MVYLTEGQHGIVRLDFLRFLDELHNTFFITNSWAFRPVCRFLCLSSFYPFQIRERFTLSVDLRHPILLWFPAFHHPFDDVLLVLLSSPFVPLFYLKAFRLFC